MIQLVKSLLTKITKKVNGPSDIISTTLTSLKNVVMVRGNALLTEFGSPNALIRSQRALTIVQNREENFTQVDQSRFLDKELLSLCYKKHI